MTSLTGKVVKISGLHTDVKICSLKDTSTARDCIGVPGVTNLRNSGNGNMASNDPQINKSLELYQGISIL